MIEDRQWQRPLATGSHGWPLETKDVSGGSGWVADSGGESGGSVGKFWVRWKMVYDKWKYKPIFAISASILQSTEKQFLIDYHFSLLKKPVNAEK